MSLFAHSLLVTRLKALTAVSDIVGTRVYPIIAPQGTKYPCVVYQVLSNEPLGNDLDGTDETFKLTVRISALSLTSAGEQGYKNAWDLAAAIIGDCAATNPSGLSGWADSYGNVWHMTSAFDEVGTIMAGRDQFDAFVVNLVLEQTYSITEDEE